MNGLAVRVLEAGFDEESQRYFEIQEYITGGDLTGLIAMGPLEPAILLALTRELTEAIAKLHSLDIIHRDIKPDNILIRSNNPFKIALSDFGISSLLAPDISIKETRLANTPLYSAPESFGSIVGKASDWWSLGAVLLEAAIGSHPLARLSFNEVLREITTRGLQVPDTLPPDLKILLKGLLTRDDRKRWRHAEAQGWLSGGADIPLHYESGEIPQEETPYVIDGQSFEGPAELAVYIASGENQWRKGREHLARGYIRQWLEKRGALDAAIEAQANTDSPDAAAFNFVQAFAPQLGHVYWGEIISFNNIAYFLANRTKIGRGPQTILTDLQNGRLAPLPQIAANHKRPFDEKTQALLAYGKPLTPQTLATLLAVVESPDEWLWGETGPPDTPAKIIKFVLTAACPLIDKSYWRANVPEKAVIPVDIFENGLNSAATYNAGAGRLLRLVSENILVGKYLRRQSSLAVEGLGLVKVSPLTTEEMVKYRHWLHLDERSRDLENFDSLVAIDELERGSRFKLAGRLGFIGRLLNPKIWGQVFLALILILGPLVWAIDGLRLFTLDNLPIPDYILANYRALERYVFYGAGGLIVLIFLFWTFGRLPRFLLFLVLGGAGGFALWKHGISVKPYLQYVKFVVFPGFCLLCVYLAFRVRLWLLTLLAPKARRI
jgi:hypothetical protein